MAFVTHENASEKKKKKVALRLFADAQSFVSGKEDHSGCIYETTYFIPR